MSIQSQILGGCDPPPPVTMITRLSRLVVLVISSILICVAKICTERKIWKRKMYVLTYIHNRWRDVCDCIQKTKFNDFTYKRNDFDSL